MCRRFARIMFIFLSNFNLVNSFKRYSKETEQSTNRQRARSWVRMGNVQFGQLHIQYSEY